MQNISLTGSPSPQRITYSMTPSSTGEPRNNHINPESVPIQKHEQFTQVCYIKTGLENYIYQLVTT